MAEGTRVLVSSLSFSRISFTSMVEASLFRILL
jgi:hypothetical protein